MTSNVLRSALIALSQNKTLRSFAEQSRVGQKMSGRFIAGLHVSDALHAAETLNREGIPVSLDSLGENVSTEEEARRAAEIYHQLLDAIQQRGLQANISAKLTQMGMNISPSIARQITGELVDHAAAAGNFLRVDMEGSELTQATIDMTRELHAMPNHAGHIGTVLQSYLYRCEEDVRVLLGDRIRIRLCKGAYKEPPTVAFPDKADVDANYLKLTRILLTSGVFHGLATHDEAIIRATKKFVEKEGIDKRSFEFQMLYGVRRDLQTSLAKEGYGIRVYIPFGTEWYSYFMRRLAERPANVLFIAKNLLR
ncbi:MAG TPA: proline dehydrogenase family protein [Acidobacteriaceae bacterium]|nr:proline dehydrogenase family protein [Acidobacteriaceae bacterium]